MTFGEWLDTELEWWSQHPIMGESKHTNLMKMVHAQRELLLYSLPHDFSARDLTQRTLSRDIEKLEAALMEK